MFAKQVANEWLAIALPALVEEVDYETEAVAEARRVKFDEAILEKRTGQIVPDVILVARGRRLIVEFRVTHECGPEKIARIRELNVAAIEIDLSNLHGTRLKDLAAAILFRAPRKWLHHPKSKAAQARARARAQLRRAAVANEVAAQFENYHHRVPAEEPGDGPSEVLARARGMGDLINLDVRGSGCFDVPVAEWQASVLLMLLRRSTAIDAADLVRELNEHGAVAKWAIGLPEDVETGLRGSIPNFLTPEEAVSTYLDELVVRQAVFKRPLDGQYLPHRRLVWMVRKAHEDQIGRAGGASAP
jgi:hypothetical protein